MVKIKRFMVSALAAAVMFTSVVPATVSAQIAYDPTAEVNHGVYIDTCKVPNDENIKLAGKQITVVRNVKFQLFCNVDSKWSVSADLKENENGGVKVDPKSGVVSISEKALDGYYTVTATAEDVLAPITDSIKIKVDASKTPARATNIVLDKELIEATDFDEDEDLIIADENKQIVVSEDGKTMNVKGTVKEWPLHVKYEPDYLLDNKVVFSSTSADTAYKITGESKNFFTSLKKAEKTKLRCTVGTGECEKLTEFDVNISNVALDHKIACKEIAQRADNNNTYDILADQFATFILQSNEPKTLPVAKITEVEWTLTQNNENLKPEKEKQKLYGSDYFVYKIYDEKEKTNVADIYVEDAVISKHIIVTTMGDTDSCTVKDVTFRGTVTPNSDNAGNAFNTKEIRLCFNMTKKAEPGSTYIDFAEGGLLKDVDYTVKANDEFGLKDVYYFEADGKNLDLSKYTFADTKGVYSFINSKANHFQGEKAKYTVSYQISGVSEAVFGKAEAAKQYNNTDLKKDEFNADGTLKANNILTKTGTGYMVLSVLCREGNKEVSNKQYVLRFVSPSDDLNTKFTVSKNSDLWYALSSKEVVHVRQGEAVVPGFYKHDAQSDNFKNADKINIFDPYIEYDITDEKIATATPDVDLEAYRVNGLNEGIVTVTAHGTVNRTNSQEFTFYVNKDILEGEFEINFTDAIKSNKMETGNVIIGRQDSVPVTVRPLSGSMAQPKLTWTLNCDPSVAVIDPNTGVITTKTSYAENITVTATSAFGTYKDSKTFTIKAVEATTITAISELPAVGGATVLTNVDGNKGTCKVGNSFTLVPSEFAPVEATSFSGVFNWVSSNPACATVSNTGVVTAISETEKDSPVEITCTYTPLNGASPVGTKFFLTVVGYADNSADSTTKVTLKDKKATYTGKAINIGKATVTGSTGAVSYIYYIDAACEQKTTAASGAVKVGAAPKNVGTYYVRAIVTSDGNYSYAISNPAKLTIVKAKQTVKGLKKTYTVKAGKKVALGAKMPGKFTVKKTSGDKKITISGGKISVKAKTAKKTYTVKVKFTAKATSNYKATTVTKTIKVKVK